jgi:hypothetical protein
MGDAVGKKEPTPDAGCGLPQCSYHRTYPCCDGNHYISWYRSLGQFLRAVAELSHIIRTACMTVANWFSATPIQPTMLPTTSASMPPEGKAGDGSGRLERHHGSRT